MSTFFIADTHLGHGNILKYCHRPFLTEEEKTKLAEEEALLETFDGDRRVYVDNVHKGLLVVSQESIRNMDATIIDNINAVVREDDTLWHIGDFCWGDFKVAQAYRDRIACQHVNLIWGNHDKNYIRPLFEEAYDQTMITVEGQYIFLNHYPMMSWNGSFKGTWQLFGHVHGNSCKNPLNRAAMETKLSLDVGVDGPEGPGSTHTFRPWSMPEIRKYMQPKLIAHKVNRSV